MSGYQALRVAEGDGSRGHSGGRTARHGDQADPVVLARVADFRPVPDEVSDEPLHSPYDEPADEGEPQWLVLAKKYKPQLTVAGLMLAIGLVGFLLGRWTSPDAPEDPRAWKPASMSSQGPAWNGQGLIATGPTSARQAETSRLSPMAQGNQPVAAGDKVEPGPWGPPAVVAPATNENASGPNWGQTPPVGPDLSNDANRMSRWKANQGMTLPEAGSPGQPTGARPLESDPYAAARVAQRSMMPAPAVGPPAQTTAPPSMPSHWQPNPQYPPERAGSPGTAPYGAAPSGGQTNANYPNAGYPSGYPQTNQTLTR